MNEFFFPYGASLSIGSEVSPRADVGDFFDGVQFTRNAAEEAPPAPDQDDPAYEERLAAAAKGVA